MSKVAAHVKTARKLGAQAGLTQLYETLVRNTNGGTNGLPQAQAMLNEIESVGKVTSKGSFRAPKRAVAWYCNHFANVLPNDLPAVIETKKRVIRKNDEPTVQEPTTTDPTPDTGAGNLALIQAAIKAGATPEQLAAIVGAAQGTSYDVEDGHIQVGDEADLDDEDVEDDEDDDTDDTEVVQGTRVRRVTRGTETATPYPAPKDPDADATNGKLWTLNTEGPDNGLFMVIVDSDFNLVAGGEAPLKNGECHELIAQIRA